MTWQRDPTDDELRDVLQRDRHWFQKWEIRPGIVTPGKNDITKIMDDARVPEDLAGKRVLDIGSYTGCVAFECERRGAADVVALDLMDPAVTGFQDLADTLGSEVTWRNGSMYTLDPATHGVFDVVICFGVLYHLRWPTLGLDRLRTVATGSVHVETHVIDNHYVHPRRWFRRLKEFELRHSSVPVWRYYAARELHPEDASNFFGPNTHAVVAALDDIGITTEHTASWDDRAAFAGTVRPGLNRQHDVYEALHSETAALMGIDVVADPLFDPATDT